MGQAEVLIEMEKRLNELKVLLDKIDSDDQRMQKVWEGAFSKGDLSVLLGVSMDAVAKNLHKLLLQDEIISLKNGIDKRARRYVRKDEFFNGVVNNRDD